MAVMGPRRLLQHLDATREAPVLQALHEALGKKAFMICLHW